MIKESSYRGTTRWALFSLLSLSLAGAVPVSAQGKIPVILSTDVGNEIDDQWAILYTLFSDEFEVLGVISAHAPSIAPPAGHTAYRILRDIVEERLAMDVHPPLLEGASFPLKSKTAPQPSEGASFIVQASQGFSENTRLRVLTIGAGTDVASALLMDPSLSGRIQVLLMGFDEWPKGGDGFNILNDVKAAQVIFESNVPIVVGCATVCTENLGLKWNQAKEMVSERGPVGRWLWDEYQAFYYRYVKPMRMDDFSKPWIIWDTIVVAHLLGFTQHATYDRPVLNDDVSFSPGDRKKQITWITDVDEEGMWADFLEKLDRHQRTYSVGPYRFRTRLTFPMP